MCLCRVLQWPVVLFHIGLNAEVWAVRVVRCGQSRASKEEVGGGLRVSLRQHQGRALELGAPACLVAAEVEMWSGA